MEAARIAADAAFPHWWGDDRDRIPAWGEIVTLD